MNLIERVKNILTAPQKEWGVINGEEANPAGITTTYILPLTLIGAVAAFIGFGLIGLNYGFFRVSGTEWGIKMAISYAIRAIGGVYILAFVIDALAPNFGAEKNFGKSFQVAAYSSTAGMVGAILLIIPSLAILALVASIYGLYLLYIGLPVLKPAPEDKKMNYFVVTLVVAIVVTWVLSFIANKIFNPAAFGTGSINLG